MPKVSEHLSNTLNSTVLKSSFDKKSVQEVIWIHPEKIREVVLILKTELGYDMLIDIIAIDWMGKKPNRFEIAYLFYSTGENTRVHLKAELTDNGHPEIGTICDIYGSANWAERECWDMMGVTFKGHPGLRRILMWEEFEGHPLRKDYPLAKRQPIPRLDDLI